MADIGEGDSGIGKSLDVGFWDSQLCDNSLAAFPDGTDFSWGFIGIDIDGCDVDNYVELKLLDENNTILKNIRLNTNGRKKIDISDFSNVNSTQDIKIRIEITTWI